jgi:hypothetical protein
MPYLCGEYAVARDGQRFLTSMGSLICALYRPAELAGHVAEQIVAVNSS